ncbi:MAG: DUF1957 domain-containing protein [FCB group bacterium]|nr:DUF1957 domain-containing protein [FCB group bacterium]
MMKNKPAFSFILHTHLPYVISHGTWPHGTDWLYEAAAECYIPLLNAFYKLHSEGISPKVTIDLSPVLTEQLADDAFVTGLHTYLEERIEAGKLDLKEFTDTGQPDMLKIAGMWTEYYTGIKKAFIEKYNENIPGAFRKLEEAGALEIITCGATHGYLPLLGTDQAVNAQLRQAKQTHKTHFGRDPQGIWLPECAYRPGYNWKTPVESTIEARDRVGIETFLSKEKIRYFIVDIDLLKGGEGVDVYLDRFPGLKALYERMEAARVKLPESDKPKTHFRPYWVGGEYGDDDLPVAVFVRDPDTALVVWSGAHGYPGDGNYLEFHKKRFPNGHRYWKVTSSKADLADKDLYDPEIVKARLTDNSDHFVSLVEDQLTEAAQNMDVPPFLISPYDTELFGHWWFEGPLWIEQVLRKLHNNDKVQLVTAGEYLENYPPDEAVSLPEGSWGQGGFHWIWLNDDTKWTWIHLYKDEQKMIELVKTSAGLASADFDRVLKQLGRELLLEQASDWQFLISTFSAKDYAETRFAEHHDRFVKIAALADKIVEGDSITTEEWNYLTRVEKSDSIFPEIDPSIWS